MLLLADMGGTNIRFAVFNGRQTVDLTHYKCADFPTFSDALTAYSKKVGKLPASFVLAVPGPVQTDKYNFVNNSWQFSLKSLKKEFAFTDIQVVNDFEAAALALPFLSSKDVIKIKAGRAQSLSPKLIMGAGTGLGVGVLLSLGKGQYKTIHSEGGHITFADTNDWETKIKQFIIEKYGHISAERVISGKGLQNIYQALTGSVKTSEEIVQDALKKDKKANKALFQMFAFWGDVAGDLALAFGAKGGIYLTGNFFRTDGVLDLLKQSDFCNRFENKGRYTKLMQEIPVYVVVRKETAFLGLRAFGTSNK